MSTSIIEAEQLDEIPNTKTTLVGVYGTLKRGFFRHIELGTTALYRGNCTIPGIMFHMHTYPMVIKIPEDIKWRATARTEVEVYEIETQRILVLDGIEGHPFLFKRTSIWDPQFGRFFTYYGANPRGILKGTQDMIPKNVWNGPSTKYVRINFHDGTFTQKPKIDLSVHHAFKDTTDKFTNTSEIEGVIVDVSTGEIEKVNIDRLSCVSVAPNPPHYQRRYWDSDDQCYVNENGEVLVYDYATANWVKKNSKNVPAVIVSSPVSTPKQPDPPSVVTVPKTDKLNSPFPKIVSL